MDPHLLQAALKRRLSWPLPGVEAQKQLSPEPRDGWDPGYVPEDARPGAGLALLFPADAGWSTVLTLRHRDLKNHGGQLSLPGGRVEEGESIEQTALREAQEEVGLDPTAVNVVGRLSPLYIPVSGFVLHPVVGVAAAMPDWVAEANEVESILPVTLEHLLDPEHRFEDKRRYEDQRYRVPFVRVGVHRLWGATAMVVAELLEVWRQLDD